MLHARKEPRTGLRSAPGFILQGKWGENFTLAMMKIAFNAAQIQRKREYFTRNGLTEQQLWNKSRQDYAVMYFLII